MTAGGAPDGSPLELLVDSVLLGAQAALHAGLDNAAIDDPGRERAEQVAAWLGGQVRPGQADRGPAAGPAPAPAPGDAEARTAAHSRAELTRAFADVLAAFGADEMVHRQLGGLPAACAGPADGDAWRSFWLSCLRLDPQLAARWRAAGRDAAVLAMATGEPDWVDLPAGDGTAVRVLLPPAPALGVAGIRERPGAPMDPSLGNVGAAPGAGPLVQRLLALAVQDRELCHALEGLQVAGIHPLKEVTTAAEYRREILQRLRRAARQDSDRLGRLQSLYQLDEAICSAVHQPPAHQASWWGELATSSRRLLQQAAHDAVKDGLAADVRPLELLPYADLRGYTSGRNIPYRVPRDQVGTVLACLRTWMDLDGQVYPGRVIWGSELPR